MTLETTLKTSTAFRRFKLHANDFGGFDIELDGGFGRAAEIRFTQEDAECDSYGIYVFDHVQNTLMEATVPLCAVIATGDALLRSSNYC